MTTYKARYDSSHALIVAIDQYHHLDSLSNAVRGANALADLLQTAFGFQTYTLFNDHVTQDGILEWFTTLDFGADDRVLFYFAGHGLTRQTPTGDIGYLALPATQPGRYHTAVRMDQIIEEAELLAAKHVLVLLDACFGGLALKKRSVDFKDRRTETEKFVDMLITRPVRYAITAGGNEVVDDGAAPGGQYSAFTYYMLQGLQGEAQESEGLIRAKHLASYLEKRVAGHRNSNHKPNHGYLTQVGDGDFVFKLPDYISSTITTKACEVRDPQNILDKHSASILKHLKRSDQITILEKVTIGRSGSKVFLVDVASQDGNGNEGLQFCKLYRTPTGEEKYIHETVYNTQLGEHIPKLIDHTPVLDGWMASLYGVAHQTTLRGSQSLSTLMHKNMLAAIDSVKDLVAMLEQWNPLPFTREHSDPWTLLRRPIRRFMSGSDVVDHYVTERIGSLIKGLTPEALEIQYVKQVLPNPIAFLSSPELWQGSRSILWPAGHTHGDLHSNNVMCLLDQKNESISGRPVIVDFDTYDGESCLFFDFAYLELDISMRMLNPIDIGNREAWLDISQYLARSIELQPLPPLEPKYFPLHGLLVPIRGAVSRLCQYQPGDFEAAFWLARTSAGLSFARKRKISSSERMLVLLLAAQSLERALEVLEIDHRAYRQPFWMNWLDETEW